MSPRWETSFPEPLADAADDPGTVGRRAGGVSYRCLSCGWEGKSAKAYTHHCENPAHQIVLRDAPQLGAIAFGCCSELAQPSDHTRDDAS